MYSVSGTTIKMTRGDTVTVTLTLTQSGSTYTPDEDDSILFAVKSKLNAARTAYVDSSALISKTISVDTMTLTIDPEDTAALDFGSYYYDIQVTLADGTVDTVINNAILEILPEVA